MKMLRPRRLNILFLSMVVVAGATYLPEYSKGRTLHSIPEDFEKFSLSDPPPLCGLWKEHMPAKRDASVFQLYISARKAWRSKVGWQLTREESLRILADVTKAADMGDWGARALLAHFYLNGFGVLESNHVLDANPVKAVEIQRLAAKEMQPWALYDLGVMYEHGYGGLPQSEEIAWAYYLRAAKLGSPEAQMALASAYMNAGRSAEEEAMQRCAYLQGHGAAAFELGLGAEVRGRLEEAIHFYQQGVKFGCEKCATALRFLFKDGHWSKAKYEEQREALALLGVHIDIERSRRYRTISEALKINPDLKLSRLDTVLPLPPAQLPAWSGIEDAIELETSGPPSY